MGGLRPLTRSALLRTLLPIAGGLFASRQPALAAYTTVPTGTIAAKIARQAEVEKEYALNPDNPYVYGEKAQLVYDIEKLRANKAFVANISSSVRSGAALFPQRLTVAVDNLDAEIVFWKGGMGALVRSTRLIDGRNHTVIAFGPESFGVEDGAKFSLELIQSRPGSATSFGGADSALQYLQMAMPVFRLSQVMEFGGEIESAYGWTELRTPSGLPLRVRIDESRRDPFEFVALRVKDLKQSTRYCESLGLRAGAPKGKKELSFAGTTIFKDDDAIEPDREVGSILMSAGSPELTTGVLLLPPRSRKALDLGLAPPRLRVLGAPAGTQPPPAGAPPLAFVGMDELEAALAEEVRE